MAEFDWGQAYMRSLRQGGAGGTGYVPGVSPEGVMYANDLITSGKNIGSGQGGFLDYLNVLLAPTALAGYGAFKGVRAADKLAANTAVKRILQNPDISIVAPRQAMPEILSSRFKSQRELMSERGQLDPTKFGRREAVEQELMGYPLDTPLDQRPIYGAVANSADLPQWLVEKTPGQFGDALRLFDPRTNRSGVFGAQNAVINRVPASSVEGTVTIGDSWVPAVDQAFNLNRLQSPEVRQNILQSIAEARASRGAAPFAIEGKLPYIEAQMAATKNPVDAIRRIDVPPSYSEVWNKALMSAPDVRTVGGQRVLDPIVNRVPAVTRQLARRPDAETMRFQELLYNNPSRPLIPQRNLNDLLLPEKAAVRSVKRKAFQ